MSEGLTPCPVCGKVDQLIALPCKLGQQYERDIFCRRCQCKITESKWDTRTLTPKQQCADEMYAMLEEIMNSIEVMNDDDHAKFYRIRTLLTKARGEQ